MTVRGRLNGRCVNLFAPQAVSTPSRPSTQQFAYYRSHLVVAVNAGDQLLSQPAGTCTIVTPAAASSLYLRPHAEFITTHSSALKPARQMRWQFSREIVSVAVCL